MEYLAGLGTLAAAGLSWKGINGLSRFSIAHFTRPKVDFSKMKTAIITGAADGIGKAYTNELARLGLKRLVLIDKNHEGLKAVAKEIASKFPNIVETRLIVADFTKTDIYDGIERDLADIHDVDVLVNNVGANINAGKPLHEVNPANLRKTLNINITTTWMMSHIVVRKMIADNRRGAIINMSSMGYHCLRSNFLYDPSKCYITRFSRQLRHQYQNDKYGITVQEVEPFLVTTKTARNITGTWIVTPETLAKQALMTVGHQGTTHGAIRHELFKMFISLQPGWFVQYLFRREFKKILSNAAKDKQREGQPEPQMPKKPILAITKNAEKGDDSGDSDGMLPSL